MIRARTIEDRISQIRGAANGDPTELARLFEAELRDVMLNGPPWRRSESTPWEPTPVHCAGGWRGPHG